MNDLNNESDIPIGIVLFNKYTNMSYLVLKKENDLRTFFFSEPVYLVMTSNGTFYKESYKYLYSMWKNDYYKFGSHITVRP